MSKLKDPKYFLLETNVTTDDIQIKSSKLPTIKQVLLSFLARKQELRSHDKSHKIVFKAASMTVDEEIVKIYEQARIPIQDRKNMAHEIIKLYESMENLIRIPKDRRNFGSSKYKIEKFKNDLNNTMKLWPKNVDDNIEFDEDRVFLRDMQSDRKFTMGGVDKNLSKTEKQIAHRQIAQLKRKNSEEERRLSQENQGTSSTFDISDGTDSDDTPSIPIATKASHKRLSKTGVNLFMPHDILKKPAVVSSAIRNKITPTALSAIVSSIVTSCGADPEKLNLHFTQSYRYRIAIGSSISENIRRDWKPPEIGSVHWDGKLMYSLGSKYTDVERLPVLISGYEGVKLLGVPQIASKTTDPIGDIISNATKQLLVKWNCTDVVACMVFDTTSANTGHISAACISLQKKLNRALLWTACRHHVGEIVLTHTWEALKIEVAKSPEISMFVRLRKNYEKLSYNNLGNLNKLVIDDSMISVRDEVVECVNNVLCNNTFAYRGDYTQLLKLTLVLLTGDVSNFKFTKPGAISKARWMSKVIYATDIFLLTPKILTELPKGEILAPRQAELIERFVKFVALIYVKWWVNCPLPADCPINDLEFLKSIQEYPDNVIALAAEKAFRNHLWYLTQELVPLAIFSTSLNCNQKENLRKALIDSDTHSGMNFSNRYGSSFGKPKFPSFSRVPSELTAFVGPDSMMCFKILQLDTSFLHMPVTMWSITESYLKAETVVNNLKVVNDAAERGVKLGSDFISAAKIEENYQNILQVVENDRNRQPNQRNVKAEPKSWHLSL